MGSARKKIEISDLRLSYGAKEVIHGISFDVYENEILGVIGTIEFSANARVSGSLKVDGVQVDRQDVFDLRRKIGMVAPLPVGLPLTIYDNVAFASRCAGVTKKSELDGVVEKCLRQAALWDEVKDRLDSLGTKLSGLRRPAAAIDHRPRAVA
jgi:phosphate transport system ATP-binding protein